MRQYSKNLIVPAIVLMCTAPCAYAQLIEDLELRREGNNAVAQIRFVTPVQYQRATVARANDLVQVYYDVLPGQEMPNLITGQSSLAGAAGVPTVTINDEGVGRGDLSRKLIIRLGAPSKFHVRAGKGNRSIELVLEGLGDAVAAAAASQTKTSAATPAPAAAPATNVSAETDSEAARLLKAAIAAQNGGNHALTVDNLNQLLALPNNASSRQAQELIGVARQKLGDNARARSEYETFLKLYPTGADSERVRQQLASLPAATAATRVKPSVTPTTTTSGSISSFYYGGKSQVRTQDFKDSPLGGLPELQSDNTLSAIDQKQLQTNVDLNWRYRDADVDRRFVFRDAYTADLRSNGVNKNRLSALYYDQKSFVNGTSFRVGRQSPTGGGVLYRFDGATAGYAFAPKWKLNGVVGVPTDVLLDAKRSFYGVSVDADALTPEIGGNVYLIQQMIDGEVDRRAVGTEMRYFSGGVSASTQLDYDTIVRKLNIASLQATWQTPDSTVVNFLYDRRATPIVSLGNALFFQDPALTAPARRVSELLNSGTSLAALRDQVKAITAFQTQAALGVTTPLSKNWQIGADLRLTNVGALAPVAVILPQGQASTGDLWSLGAQLIGSNLYSARDTHVFSLNYMTGPTYHGTLLSYNNLSALTDKWQLEPSLKYYVQNDTSGTRSKRLNPGLRVSYKVLRQLTAESELSYEYAKTTSNLRNESSHRMSYYLGIRYDF